MLDHFLQQVDGLLSVFANGERQRVHFVRIEPVRIRQPTEVEVFDHQKFLPKNEPVLDDWGGYEDGGRNDLVSLYNCFGRDFLLLLPLGNDVNLVDLLVLLDRQRVVENFLDLDVEREDSVLPKLRLD